MVLNVFATFDVDAPDQPTFARVREMDAVVTGLEDVDFPDGLAVGLPVMHTNHALPFAELLHPSLLRLFSTFDRGKFSEDLPEINADPDRLEQVFINLLLYSANVTSSARVLTDSPELEALVRAQDRLELFLIVLASLVFLLWADTIPLLIVPTMLGNSLDSYNGTGLIRAADRGHVEIIEELLKTDIDIDHVNRLDWTALLEAIILGDGGSRHTEVVRFLVEAGADVNLADGAGITPLAHARQRGFVEMIKLLEGAQ